MNRIRATITVDFDSESKLSEWVSASQAVNEDTPEYRAEYAEGLLDEFAAVQSVAFSNAPQPLPTETGTVIEVLSDDGLNCWLVRTPAGGWVYCGDSYMDPSEFGMVRVIAEPIKEDA